MARSSAPRATCSSINERPRAGTTVKLRLLPTLASLALLVIGGASLAQFPRSRPSRGFSGSFPRTAREYEQHTDETPKWANTPGFEKDVFTFVRIKYATHGRRGHPYGDQGR